MPETSADNKPGNEEEMISPDPSPGLPVIRKKPETAGVIEAVALGLFLIYLLFFILHAARVIPYPHDVDNGEGFLLWQATRYSEGRLPYLPVEQSPHMVSNYPPLYPLLVSFFLPWTGGPTLAVGRWIAFLCSLAVAAGVGWTVYRQSQQSRAGWIAGLLFISCYHVYLWGAFHRVDMPALFFSLLALGSCVAGKHWAWTLVACTLALCTRQTALAAPLAIGCFWLSRKEIRKAIFLWGGLVILVGGVTLLLSLLTGGEYFKHIVVYNRNEFIWETVFFYFLHLWKFYAVIAAVGLFYWLLGFEKKKFDLAFWFLSFSVLSAMLCGKVGSAPNYFLELMLALSWTFGLARAQIRSLEPPGRRWFYLLFACLLLLQGLQTFHVTHFPPALNNARYDFTWTPTPEQYQQEEVLGYLIRKESGPVLIEDPGMALVNGKEVYYQPFILTQLERQGLWNPEPLLDRIREQEFSLIVLREDIRNTPEGGTDRMSKTLSTTLNQYYKIDQVLPGARTYFLLRPERG
jgi:hypothetical protein